MIKNLKSVLLICITCLMGNYSAAQNSYVYTNGTCWVTDFYDIIDASDPSVFESASYEKTDNAEMWDREANNNKGAWITPLSWIYNVNYNDGITAKIRVRQTGFSKSQADSLAERYGTKMGQLPACLRQAAANINILKSDALFGGNNSMKSIDITVGKTSALYEQTGNLEETLFHEATHAGLDYLYQQDWAPYRDKDPKFISKYAAENPDREDISESFLLYAALDYRNSRITSEAQKIKTAIPNRLTYYEKLGLDMHPLVANKAMPAIEFDSNAYYRLTTQWQGEGKSLDIINDGTNNRPVLAPTAKVSGQMWKINKIGEGMFTLSTLWQGPAKTLESIRGAHQNQPVLKEGSDYSGSVWRITPVGNGYYRIANLWLSDHSLDVVNDGENNKIKLVESGNYTGQFWKITKIE